MRVIPLREHASPPSGQAVELAGEAHRETPHTAGERRLICGLHQQVRVGVLEREVDDPEPVGACVVELADRRLECGQLPLGAELAHLVGDAEGDVLGMRGHERGARAVRNGAAAVSLATGARAGSAPSGVERIRVAGAELELLGVTTSRAHLNAADI
jgi:hypothetical protein